MCGHYADFPLKQLQVTRVLEGRSMPRLDRTAQEIGHIYSGIQRDPQKNTLISQNDHSGLAGAWQYPFWEGARDKNEDGFFVFLGNFGNMVRSTSNGFYLEGMLDSKLRRASMSQCSVPSCLLLDPDFAVYVAPH